MYRWVCRTVLKCTVEYHGNISISIFIHEQNYPTTPSCTETGGSRQIKFSSEMFA